MIYRKYQIFILGFSIILSCFSLQEASSQETKAASSDLITKAWDAQGKREFDKAIGYAKACIDIYKDEADKQHAVLKDYPGEYQMPLSDVAVAYFIEAEALMRQEKWAEAIKKFEYVVTHYRYAVAWDPSRGVYWEVAKVSQESIDKIKEILSGKVTAAQSSPQATGLKTKVVLYDSGKADVVDYERYGKFTNIGSKEYKFIIKDQDGLCRALGEGIYPNTTSVRWDPEFKKAKEEKRLNGSHWDFVHSQDLEAAFLKWATAAEPEGVKLFYTAGILEKSGLIKQALKAYYAIVVHYPGAVGWTYWHTPWYAGPAAISKINFLLAKNPQLRLKLAEAKIRIINGYDSNVSNDIVITNPGRFERIPVRPADILTKAKDIFRISEGKKEARKRVGSGQVRLEQYTDGSWQLMVSGKPYLVKGITYAPSKIGQSPDEGTLANWMFEDLNKNGRIDGPYDSYLENAPSVSIGDFQLMKDMGVNTIRLYQHPLEINKTLLSDLFNKYGIRVIIGDFLGKYAIGSGAPWNPGTDYRNPEHQKTMLASVTKMVEEYKDEPFLLFWVLGNENVYGVACNADKDPEGFLKFANQAALLIKSLDKNHPVAIASGDVLFLDRFAQFCPDIDIFGTNAYRGDYGFGNLWQAVKEEADKPVLPTEFGCPAYARGMGLDEAEDAQASYHKGAWEDIVSNTNVNCGAGNAIGGIAFEFLDEWWKAYEPYKHDTKGFFTGPFPDGYMHEEWLGLVSQGDGKDSPFKRHLRKSYYMYQKAWK